MPKTARGHHYVARLALVAATTAALFTAAASIADAASAHSVTHASAVTSACGNCWAGI